MTEISFGAVLPVTQDEAFAFVSDPRRWPLFYHYIQTVERLDGWGRVGGRIRIVSQSMGEHENADLELVEWDQPREFTYTMVELGRPDVVVRQVFEPDDGGTRLTGTATVTVRRGLGGTVDRWRCRGLRRRYEHAMSRLSDVIPRERVGPSARI